MKVIKRNRNVEEKLVSIETVSDTLRVVAYANRDGKTESITHSLSIKEAKKLRKQLGEQIKVAKLQKAAYDSGF